MNRATLKVGIIGLGHIGKYHIQAIERVEGIELVAVCDLNKEYAALVDSGISFYTSYDQMLNNRVFDAIIVATPNDTHYAISKAVLESGNNLIVEKPAADSLEKVIELVVIAKSQKLFIYFAFHAALAFEVTWLNNYMKSNENGLLKGPITGFYSTFFDPYITDEGEIVKHAIGLQNCWLDSGINALSVIQRFIDLNTININTVHRTKNAVKQDAFIQCEVNFSYQNRGNLGAGIINTNWSTGLNFKATELTFGQDAIQVVLNHTTQKIFLIQKGKSKLLKDASEGMDRLLNHYIGVFNDFKTSFIENNSNSAIAIDMHNILFKAQKI